MQLTERSREALASLNTALAFALPQASVPLLHAAPMPRASHGSDDGAFGGSDEARDVPRPLAQEGPSSPLATPVPSATARGDAASRSGTVTASGPFGDLSLALSSGSDLDDSVASADGPGDQLQWTI